MSAEWIWHNGEFMRWEEVNVHVSTHALHYGSSVFEGIRAYTTPHGPAVFRLPEHTRRLFYSCKVARLDIPFTEDEINEAILETIARNGHQACYVRPLVYRGAGPLGLEGRKNPVDVTIFTMEWGAYLGVEGLEKGVDVQISSWRRLAPGTAASMAKIGGQYVNSQLINMEAHDNGFDEGLALDYSGNVSEGAGENVFVIVDGVVYTPGGWASIFARNHARQRADHPAGSGRGSPLRNHPPRHVVPGRRSLLHRHGGGDHAGAVHRPSAGLARESAAPSQKRRRTSSLQSRQVKWRTASAG